MTTVREATARLAELLRHEHHALADFLVALSVFDRERRWEALGYRSLFAFLTRELGLSKGAAYYRMTAAGLVRRFPEVAAALGEGTLCLSSTVELAKVLTLDNLSTVLPRFLHVSKREAKEVTAELLPAAAPPLRTVVTPVQRLQGHGDGASTSGCDLAGAGAEVGAGVGPGPGPGAGAGANVGVGVGVGVGCAGGGGDAAIAEERRTCGPGEVDRLPGDGPGLVAHDLAASEGARTGTVLMPFTDSAVHLANLAHASSRVPGVSSASSGISNPGRGRYTETEPLTAELTRLHVTVPRRLLRKLAAARDALSHSHPSASDAEILELGLDLIVERHRKRRGIGAKARQANGAAVALAVPDGSATPTPTSTPTPAPTSVPTPPATATATATASPTAPAPAPASASAQTPAPVRERVPPSKRSRHVPAHVWRAVWARDGGRCVWPLEGGGVCGSTRRLQLDHIDGWALGADTIVDRCRLLCSAHNLQHARGLYGDAVMDRHAREHGGRCSERVARWARAAAG